MVPLAAPRSSPGLVTLLLALGTLAGCLSSGTEERRDETDLPFLDLSKLVVQEHDHANRSLHRGAVNMSLVGWSEGVPAGAEGTASYNEIAVWGDYAFVGRGARGGFAIVDISNLSAPAFVGEWTGEGSGDIEVSADGNWVFVTTQRNWVPTTADDASAWTAAPEHRLPRGAYVFDVSDKANPRFESYLPLPTNGPHTAHYFRDADGTQYVLLQTYDLIPPNEYGRLRGTVSGATGGAVTVPDALSGLALGVNPVTQKTVITRFGPLPDGTMGLTPLGVFALPGNPNPTSGPIIMPHDATLQRHPGTGQLLMYVAYWDAGLVIVDLANPAQPKEIARFTDFSPSQVAALHYAEPFPALVDGRHVTVVAPEIVTAPETGQVTFIDTTDPANPRKLGHWSMPGEDLLVPPESPFIFSPHNFDAQAGFVYLAHYHGGVWVIDASTPERLAEPVTAGHYQTSDALPDRTTAAPNVFSVLYHKGHVLAADIGTGLYVLKMEPGVAREAAPEASPESGY